MNLYNSMNRRIELFEPYEPGRVSMYTCGPTVYHYAHIGNLRTYIHEDILERTLSYVGYEVKRVMNITDVGHLESDADDGEDKMLKGAIRENKTVWEVAAYYTEAFFKDCEKLNVLKPKTVAKATDYIQDYIDFIKRLEDRGYTYFANGNVYFDISKFDAYTALAKMNLDELRIANREGVEEDLHKKNPQDFVLWFTKSKFENQAMKWDSPWGFGYPGWHIECSVIALKNLGEKLDIHCGGVDHIPVHHTNEIAQTESYTGEKWTKYWWHAEFLTDNTAKMSKSSGEFLTVSLLEKKGFNPLSYRYYVLNSHYRKQLAFSFDNLKMAESAYTKLKRKTSLLVPLLGEGKTVTEEAETFKNAFKACLEDDLNTANAITVLYDVLKSNLPDEDKAYLVDQMDQVLGLELLACPESLTVDQGENEWIIALVDARNTAKSNKDFQRADEIRETLKAKGIVLVDLPQGTQWHKA